ncbi:MAG: hypothetical protein CO098_17870 [Bacteroidetes bacterium CG_4_9_14_3_um_filter_41_19]|nr:MAG: hypothetical protein CO098_17870 [Bacteroidetes bacterium CG_4_9_14_3_um_filter_41_19]
MKQITLISLIVLMIGFQGWSQSDPWLRITPKPVESDLFDLVTIPGTSRMMAVGSGATLISSNDWGVHWEVQYQPAGIARDITLNSLCFVNSMLGFATGTSSTLIKTTDGGFTWNEISLMGNDEIEDVCFQDELNGFITINNAILHTSNGGTTWDTTDLFFSAYTFTPKFLHFINNSTGFIGNTRSTFYYRTDNNGQSWEQVTINPVIEHFEITSILFLDENTGIIAGDVSTMSNNRYQLLKTEDGGNTWIEVYSDPFNYVHQLYFFNEDIGFAVGPRVMYDNMMLRTMDGGTTWQECSMPQNTRSLNSTLFLDENTGFCVGTHGQILSSLDGGENWEIQYQSACRADKINDAQIIGDSVVFLATTGYGGGVTSGSIYKSTDFGNSWQNVVSSGSFYSICFLSPQLGFALSSYGNAVISKTSDGGATWTDYDIENYDFEPSCIYFINDQVGFVGGVTNKGTIYKTTDGGETWSLNYTAPLNSPLVDIVFTDDTTGFAVGLESNVGVFLKTTNQGATWTPVSLDFYFLASKICFVNSDTGFIIGQGNMILKTTDGGSTWQQKTTPISGYAEFLDIDFPTNQVGYVTLGENEVMLLKTIDGGETWDPIEFPCTSTPTRVDFFNAEEGLVMGNKGIIFKTYSGGLVGIPEFPDDIGDKPQLLSYPNPAKEILHIELPSSQSPIRMVVFYDSQGKMIRKVSTHGNKNILAVDVSRWQNGVYFFVSTEHGEIHGSGRFVKLD